ncbi:hypothetical protein [Staphylococcus agnetis]|uniref:hypothetical protein n=1 Tax=Staphylococcus agnetis TaxID=985762 RepID=UPI0039ED1D32
MSKEHNEVKETQSLVDDFKVTSMDIMDEDDLKLINYFIDELKPYLDMVDFTIANLKVSLEDTYDKELEEQLEFYNYKSSRLHALIPQLEIDAYNLKIHLEERENGDKESL